MSQSGEKDWNPGTYARFRDLRLRPAFDLIAQIGELPEGAVVDLGCGAGAVAEALAAHYPCRRLIGVDSSPAMLKVAGATGQYSDLVETDIARWQAEQPPALIFSNAVLHWLAAHDTLFPRLAAQLEPGGVLAVQMPRQFEAPSHALLREIAGEMFPERFDVASWLAAVARPEDYARLLAPLGDVQVWETTYVQRLAPTTTAHPVRRFTESTAMRPFIEKLSDDEVGRFVSAYEVELSTAYPAEEDGTVLFPFRRVFFTLTRAG